jgi:MFS family permease
MQASKTAKPLMSEPRAGEGASTMRGVLPVAVLTLFIDLIGFSIIFPLFPAMLAYYRSSEAQDGLFGMLDRGVTNFAAFLGSNSPGDNIVLFGGLLGSLYSILQFFCAPIFGRLSDRYGRRPILLITVAGTAVSYLIWFFAGQFWVLLVARLIGGLMSGNISTASAIVADVTTEKTRSKGMAFIGIAFGLGFICGPAIGGLSSGIDILAFWPGGAAWGINPFSAPALIALALSCVNLFLVSMLLKETLPEGGPKADNVQRLLNPFRALRAHRYPGIALTNLAFFVYVVAFSGMEFSLTFLAHQRFGYTPQQNAYMMVFVGLVLTLVQGLYVQRWAHAVGPRRMVVHGMACVIPGLFIVGAANSPVVAYTGLFFMACGMAQVMPCVTSLVSLYAPAHVQGQVMGAFRSVSALGRAVGPVIACLLFWRLGSNVAYYIAAATIVVPLLLATRLPEPPHVAQAAAAAQTQGI